MSWPETEADRDLLRRAALTELQETVFRLRLASMTFREIALALDRDPSTIRHHHDRALAKLRRAYEGRKDAR